jgi:hypothetical protein
VVQTGNFQIVVGLRDIHLFEEYPAHIVVKMLTGVNDYFGNSTLFAQNPT